MKSGHIFYILEIIIYISAYILCNQVEIQIR